MLVVKRFKYRLSLGEKAENLLNRHLGSVRALYNTLLYDTKSEYEEYLLGTRESKPDVSQYGLCSRIIEIKARDDFAWLSDMNASVLQSAAADLAMAYKRFFRKQGGFPAFKKRRDGGAIRFPDSTRWKTHGDVVKLEKISAQIKCLFHRPLPNTASSCTIIKDACGDWYASFVVRVDTAKTSGEGVIGIDLGIKDLATLSDGTKIPNPKHLAQKELRLLRYQRALSRKIKGSSNRKKARIKVAKIHRSIANSRLDYIHKATRTLVNENRVIAMETLKSSNMMKNHRLAKSLSDASFGLFRRILEEKVKSSGHCHLVKLDSFYPSTQTCSCCGHRLTGEGRIKLSVRSWTCDYCLTEHDRDINAAINIHGAGVAFLKLENQGLNWSEEGCVRIAPRDRISLGLLLQ